MRDNITTLRFRKDRPWPSLAALMIALGALGCGGGDVTGLDEESVQNIDPGNASGQGFSGQYELEVRTLSCDGSCSVYGGFASVCDVGDVDYELVLINQRDGVLEVEWDEPLSRLRGGVDANGSYDVGGFGTQGGGELEISVRVEGQIEASQLAGEARSWSVGAVGGDEVDCVGRYEVSGVRPTVEDGGAWGAACHDDSDCDGQLCNDLVHRCGAPAEDGGPCALDDDCASDECDASEAVCDPA